MTKRILSLLMALIMMVGAVATANASTISDLKNKQEELEREAAEYQDIIDAKQDEIDEQQAYVDAVAEKVGNMNSQIALSHEKIAYYEGEITRLEDEAEANMELLRKRIRALYMAGDTSALEIILGASDFTDFIDKIQLVESISDYDAKLIDNIESQLDDVNMELTALNEEEAALEVKLSELNTLLAEHEQELKTLYAEQNEVEELMHSNELEQSEVNDQIEAYYEEQKRQEQANNSSNVGSGSSNTVTPGSSGGYVWPVPGFYDLTSQFYEDRTSYYHGGIDIASGGIMGATIVAAASGTVISSNNSCSHNWGKYGSCGCGGGYGNYVWIDHGNGKATVYAHMTTTATSTGSYVSAGQTIGYVGSTGSSTGAHLHFETRYYGTKYDPMSEY